MKSVHQQSVELLMSKIPGQQVPARVTIPTLKTRLLRATLILEEAFETVEALGFDMDRRPVLTRTTEFSLTGVVDGCCDIAVVATGTLSALGVHDVAVQRAVNMANLRKFGPGSYLRDDGKWIKPPDFVGPNGEIAAILAGEQDAY